MYRFCWIGSLIVFSGFTCCNYSLTLDQSRGRKSMEQTGDSTSVQKWFDRGKYMLISWAPSHDNLFDVWFSSIAPVAVYRPQTLSILKIGQGRDIFVMILSVSWNLWNFHANKWCWQYLMIHVLTWFSPLSSLETSACWPRWPPLTSVTIPCPHSLMNLGNVTRCGR